MKPVKESSPHELYLRASSAARPNVPLRLNAIITGKFLVERELDPKVQDKVRDRTIQAEKQRTERATIILENGLPPPKPPKALKKAKNITRRIPPVSSTPVPVRPPKKLSPLPQSLTDRDATVRTRVVHCLALKHRNTFEVARLVGLSDDIIDELNVLLDEVPFIDAET